MLAQSLGVALYRVHLNYSVLENITHDSVFDLLNRNCLGALDGEGPGFRHVLYDLPLAFDDWAQISTVTLFEKQRQKHAPKTKPVSSCCNLGVQLAAAALALVKTMGHA
jgi:hypothetical protein